ncbi:putative ribosome production factor 1 [Portunus trituberculatus]|uniref:Putative ribosome production factor 1 n=1 Tax=Portunus trituberculatus TaxID=210409 RepID=A0A5B7EPT9_PORTR|nr:putative ribosome production factor 1 [Portunus trituberculatus]
MEMDTCTAEESQQDDRQDTIMPAHTNIKDIKNKSRRAKAFVEMKREKRKVGICFFVVGVCLSRCRPNPLCTVLAIDIVAPFAHATPDADTCLKKLQEAKEKKKLAAKLGKNAPAKKQPHTIESLREKDDTMVEEEDEELEHEEANDEYASYFTKSYVPKILITCSDNPHTVRNGLLVIHLPEGPSALFRLSNPKLCKDIHRDYNEITGHRPEVILNNFRTRLGRVVARMLGALFHYDPEFKGRRVCTFHNQRDYIFFRHHRYEFKNTEKVKLRELGPRFTLRLQWIQQGAFDGDYEWALKRHEMETSRRRFFL